MEVAAIILLLLVFAAVTWLLYTLVKGIIAFLFGNWLLSASLYFKSNKLKPIERKAIERIVRDKTPFYTLLSPHGRERFLRRMIQHYLTNDFVGVKGVAVTREMKILLSAAATELTFGLGHSILSHFQTYYFHKGPFKLSPRYPLMHGATIPNGELHFNWQKVRDGYDDYSDGVNLAIHEFAQALVLQHKQGVIWEMEWIGEYNEWFGKTRSRLKSLGQKRKFFRRDVLKTPTEMFPVMVEEFFERPDEFSSQFPQLYNDMVSLLKLDPLNVRQDYRPSRGWW
jgi:Mlc titration factor MtfA (ptsG expression regulator)